MIRTVKPGEQFPDLIHNSDLLPLGSTISVGHLTGTRYEQRAPRTWCEIDSTNRMDPYYLNGPSWLRGVPDADTVDIPLESIEAFRWRLRDAALGAAERAGIHIRPVIEMCSAFGAPTPLLTVGGIVSSDVDIRTLPDGTVFYTGHPDVPVSMSVFERAEGMTQMVMGGRDRAAGQPVTIYSLPDSQGPEIGEVADDESLTRVALRAYRVGKTYQKNNSWCSVFDNCLSGLGITDKMFASIGATAKGPGDVVDKEGASRLPEGSILWHPYRNGRAYAVYIREDGARNMSRTRRLHGFEDSGENTHGHMTVVQTPDEPMAWRINGSMAQSLPDGVTVRIHGTERTLNEDMRRNLVSYYDYQVTGWPL